MRSGHSCGSSVGAKFGNRVRTALWTGGKVPVQASRQLDCNDCWQGIQARHTDIIKRRRPATEALRLLD